MVAATIATSDPPATDFCIWAHPFLSSPVQSSWLYHSSPPPPLFLLAPRIAPDSLPCLPCPPAVTFSIPSYICPNTARDEGWRLQSLCPWRHCKKDKPAMWKDLDIYLPKGKKRNRWSFKVMPVLKVFQRLHFSLRTESRFQSFFWSALLTPWTRCPWLGSSYQWDSKTTESRPHTTSLCLHTFPLGVPLA